MILQDKAIIVTGGSGLLGRAICADIRAKGGIAINADIQAAPDLDAGTLQLDISNEASVEQAIGEVVARYGRLDGWVNNAYPRTKDWGSKWEDTPMESWRANVDLQMNSYVLCLQKATAQMKAQGHGAIVNMGSIYGVVGPDWTVYEGTTIGNAAAYAAIKGGIINLTRYLASLYGQYGVRINCVSPGGIFDQQNHIFVANYEKKTPLRRMGLPDDIGPAVSFMLSEEARYITGQNLMVDGGWTAI